MNSSDTSELMRFIFPKCCSISSWDLMSLIMKFLGLAVLLVSDLAGRVYVYEEQHIMPNITARKKYPFPLLDAFSLSRIYTFSASVLTEEQ